MHKTQPTQAEKDARAKAKLDTGQQLAEEYLAEGQALRSSAKRRDMAGVQAHDERRREIKRTARTRGCYTEFGDACERMNRYQEGGGT